MFTIRRFSQLAVIFNKNARQRNLCIKYFSTASDTTIEHAEPNKLYPLDGIRVLDLTRIGNMRCFFSFLNEEKTE